MIWDETWIQWPEPNGIRGLKWLNSHRECLHDKPRVADIGMTIQAAEQYRLDEKCNEKFRDAGVFCQQSRHIPQRRPLNYRKKCPGPTKGNRDRKDQRTCVTLNAVC